MVAGTRPLRGCTWCASTGFARDLACGGSRDALRQDADGAHIAYQVFGDGPFDLVYVPGFASNVEYMWRVEPFELACGGSGSFARRRCSTVAAPASRIGSTRRTCRRSRRGWTTSARSWMPPRSSGWRSSAPRTAPFSARSSRPPTPRASSPACAPRYRGPCLRAPDYPCGVERTAVGRVPRRHRPPLGDAGHGRPARGAGLPVARGRRGLPSRARVVPRFSASPGAALVFESPVSGR